MESVIIGTVAALVVLGVFLLGVACGIKAAGWKQSGPSPAKATEEETRRLQEDQKAFESLLQYNIDVVYGNNPGGESL